MEGWKGDLRHVEGNVRPRGGLLCMQTTMEFQEADADVSPAFPHGISTAALECEWPCVGAERRGPLRLQH